MRTIRVTGKGQIKVRPDLMRITMTLSGLYPEYSDSLRRSSEDTEALKDLLGRFGFARNDLKTLSFSVDPERESYQDRNGLYQQRFAGYRYRHVLKLEFDLDNQRLGRILYALARCSLHPDFSISYTVKDPEASKNLLLGKAVADAKEKAAVLTRAAELSLKEIQSIDYSWGEIDFEYRPMNRSLMADASMSAKASPAYAMDIEPDDISVSDTVTVIWEIE